MKALIPCGGKGTRLRPLTHTTAKPLVPVANKPIIHYILDQIAQAGIKEVGLVMSPEHERDFREALGDGDGWGVNLTYIVDEQRGLADTIRQAKDFLDDSAFLMFLGDNLVQEGIQELVSEFIESQCDALLALKKVADPRSFGVAVMDEKNRVVRLVEKPDFPPSDLAIVGVYLFRPIIHRTVTSILTSKRGELEITDAIQKLIDMKCHVRARVLKGYWLDTGKKEDLLEANRMILERHVNTSIHGEIDIESSVIGRIELGISSKVVRSVIYGPVRIGKDVSIINSFIGPYTSIGDGCKIENTSMQYTIVLGSCQLLNIDTLEDSLLGYNCKICREENRRQTLKLFLGDNAEVTM